MGVEPYLLASTVNLIVAQRLIRRICDRCKEPVAINEQVLRRLNVDMDRNRDAVFYHGRGCATCGGTGYMGRLPIFEFLVTDSEIRDQISIGTSEAKIREMSRQRGYKGLLGSGVDRMLEGITTAEEVLGATFTQKVRSAR